MNSEQPIQIGLASPGLPRVDRQEQVIHFILFLDRLVSELWCQNLCLPVLSFYTYASAFWFLSRKFWQNKPIELQKPSQ